VTNSGIAGPGQPSAAPVLTFKGVTKTYRTPMAASGYLHALEPVDLTINRGEFIALVGPSGCGKSTLLNITAALLEATEGSVMFKDEAVTTPRRQVGVMFQAPVLLPWRTVQQNVLLPAEIYGLRKGSMDDRVRQMLEIVHLEDFKDAYPAQLSGGMQQRAALARVLVYDPEVLLMDEPFGALDEFTREAMNLELLRLTRDAGITVLFVTHNIPEAIFLADRVVVMSPRPGRVSGIVDVPFEHPRVIEIMRDPRFTDLTFQVRSILAGAEKRVVDGGAQ
jgi:NitT/TauT family transport system ATP-binding protein